MLIEGTEGVFDILFSFIYFYNSLMNNYASMLIYNLSNAICSNHYHIARDLSYCLIVFQVISSIVIRKNGRWKGQA